MPNAFTYQINPARIVFGPGTLARVAEEITGQGCRRALILSTPFQKPDADQLSQQLGRLSVGVFAEAAMHTPVEVTERALAAYAGTGADCVVALGGGSTIGLGKAIAYRTDAPQIVVATTYAGSEVTPILGQTENGVKTTVRDARILPEVVIYDPDLTLGLPVAMSVTSGLNAMAHAVEALYAQDRNPVSSLMAVEGIRALKEALPRIMADPTEARGTERSALTAPGSAARCWARLAWRCTTSSATPSAAASTCRTRRPTPSCCPMRRHTTRPRRRMPCSRQPIFSAARSAVASTTSRPPWGPPWR